MSVVEVETVTDDGIKAICSLITNIYNAMNHDWHFDKFMQALAEIADHYAKNPGTESEEYFKLFSRFVTAIEGFSGSIDAIYPSLCEFLSGFGKLLSSLSACVEVITDFSAWLLAGLKAMPELPANLVAAVTSTATWLGESAPLVGGIYSQGGLYALLGVVLVVVLASILTSMQSTHEGAGADALVFARGGGHAGGHAIAAVIPE